MSKLTFRNWIIAVMSIVMAMLIGALVWCRVGATDDGDDVAARTLGSCTGKHPAIDPTSGPRYRQQVAGRNDRLPPGDCVFEADTVIAPAGLLDSTQKAFGLVLADDKTILGAGPYPALAKYRLTAPDGDPLEVAEKMLEAGILAGPNFFLFSSQIYRYGPADDPSLLSTASARAASPVRATGAGSTPAVPIVIADTGVDPAWAKANGVGVAAAQAGKGTADVAVGRSAGHGTFIASEVRRFAPANPVGVVAVGGSNTIDVRPSITAVNTTDDFTLATELATAIQTLTMPDPGAVEGGSLVPAKGVVLNLSFGTYGCNTKLVVPAPTTAGGGKVKFDARLACGPVGLRTALLRLKSKGVVSYVAAAAGNDHVDIPFYPAAFTRDTCFQTSKVLPKCAVNDLPLRADADPWLFAVGTTGTVADPDPLAKGGQVPYSNYGSWVSLLAPGTRVEGYYPGRTGPTPIGAGQAQWSGTSFAAPCVAALLATGALGTVHQAAQAKATDVGKSPIPETAAKIEVACT